MKLSKQVAGLGLVLVLLLTLSPAPVLGCVEYGQPCGPGYWCCSCSQGYVLGCEFYDYGFKCATVGYCDQLDPAAVLLKAVGLPRKMSMKKPQELVAVPA